MKHKVEAIKIKAAGDAYRDVFKPSVKERIIHQFKSKRTGYRTKHKTSRRSGRRHRKPRRASRKSKSKDFINLLGEMI